MLRALGREKREKEKKEREREKDALIDAGSLLVAVSQVNWCGLMQTGVSDVGARWGHATSWSTRPSSPVDVRMACNFQMSHWKYI